MLYISCDNPILYNKCNHVYNCLILIKTNHVISTTNDRAQFKIASLIISIKWLFWLDLCSSHTLWSVCGSGQLTVVYIGVVSPIMDVMLTVITISHDLTSVWHQYFWWFSSTYHWGWKIKDKCPPPALQIFLKNLD